MLVLSSAPHKKKRYPDDLMPNLSDLLVECTAKFLSCALNLLPSIRAILAIECENIYDPKQAEINDKTKEKLAHA